MNVIKQAEAGLKTETLCANTNTENDYKDIYRFWCYESRCRCPIVP